MWSVLFWVSGGVPPGGLVPCPALPCPACPSCPALPCPALPCPGPALPCPALPCPALPCPALPCPAACPALPCPTPPCPALPCPALPPDALVVCWLLAFRRAAGTGREHPQPDTNSSQLCFAVTFGRLYIELRKAAESKKAPLEGGLGVNPKP